MRTILLLSTMMLVACGPEGLLPELSEAQVPVREELPLSAFAHVIEGNGWRIMLDREPKTSWARGAPQLVSRDYPSIAEVPADEGALPAEYSRWLGRPVHLLDAQGPRCTAVVTGISLVVQAGPPEDALANWRGDDETPPSSDAAIASDIWELTRPVLAAEVKPTSGDCRGALWARAADTPAPEITPGRRPPSEVAQAALAAFRELPQYRAVDDEYRFRDPEHRSMPWELFDGAHPTVSLLEDRSSQTALVVVSAYSGAYCDGYEGQLTAVWRASIRTGDYVLVGVLDDYVAPVSVSDLDGDGTPELLFENGVVFGVGPGAIRKDTLEVPSFICPC